MGELRTLVEGLGYSDVSTHLQSGNVRSRDELAAVVANNPMPEHTGDPKKFMVAFLDAAPKAGALDGIDPAEYEPDRFALVGREVYIYYPNGLMGSKLSNEMWERRIGVVATTRNWRTVTRLFVMIS